MTVRIHHSSVDRYLHENIYVTVQQILHLKYPPSHVDEAHCCALAEFLRSYKYDYESGMITVCSFYFS